MHEEDQGHEALVVVLLRCLAVHSVLRCAVDAPVTVQDHPAGLAFARVDSCSADALVNHLGEPSQPYDALWLHGYVTWHGLRSLAGTLAGAIDERRSGAQRLPILVVEGEPREGPPAWSPPESLAAQFRRTDATKQGVRVAVDELLKGKGYVHIWFSTGIGIGLAVAEEDWRKLGSLASVVEDLVKGLTWQQRHATEALALAYESLVEVEALSTDRRAVTSAAWEDDRSDSEGCVSAQVARLPDGRVFLLEGGFRRYIPSGIVAQILQIVLSPATQISPEALAAYKSGAPVHVVRGSEGSHQLIVGGKRLPLRGFPDVVHAPESALKQLEAREPLNLNLMRFPVRFPT